MSTVTSFPLSDGTSAPWFSFGTVLPNDPEELLTIGKVVIDSGILHFDCAQLYHSEKELGQIIKDSGRPRSDFYTSTKLSNPNDKHPGVARAVGEGVSDVESLPVDQVRSSVLGSLEKMGSHPDVMMIHNPTVIPAGQIKPFWQELEKMVDEGELKSSLGISNFPPEAIEEICSFAKYKPVLHEIEYHPFLVDNSKPLNELHEKHDIRIMAYGPLTPLLRHPSKGGPLVPILDRAAKRLGVDPASALLLWFKAKGVIPITSTIKPERVVKMGELARRSDGLTEQEVKAIDDLSEKVHFRFYTEHLETMPESKLPVDI